jgi:hypothetical protein
MSSKFEQSVTRSQKLLHLKKANKGSCEIMDNQSKVSLITRTRRNHGLEHATINVLSERFPGLRLAGYSTPYGFSIVGPVSREALTDAIDEALQRVSAGRRGLVIHERCGTNFVAGGLLAGLAAWLGMQGSRRNARSQLERLPLVILLSTLALLYSPAVGTWLQRNVTTTSQLIGVEVERITYGRFGKYPRFTVYTRNN